MNITKVQIISGYNMEISVIKYIIDVKIRIVKLRK